MGNFKNPEVKALDDVSFNMRSGEILGLIGPNGSRKTTLFNLITGTFPVTSVSIQFKVRDLSGFVPSKIAAMVIVRSLMGGHR